MGKLNGFRGKHTIQTRRVIVPDIIRKVRKIQTKTTLLSEKIRSLGETIRFPLFPFSSLRTPFRLPCVFIQYILWVFVTIILPFVKVHHLVVRTIIRLCEPFYFPNTKMFTHGTKWSVKFAHSPVTL